MKLVLIGATNLTLRCAEAMRSLDGIELAGIVTAPQQFRISYSKTPVNNVLHADLAAAGRKLGAPVALMTDKMSDPELLNVVKEWRPDAFLVVGWYHMVPKAYRSIAPAYGMHASLLPEFAGGAPLVWAIINGRTKTGMSLFRMDDGVDTGDIVGQAEVSIRLNDTIASLYARVEDAGVALLKSILPQLAAGTATFTPQRLQDRPVWPQRSPSDGRIDWKWSALAVYNFIRAQTRPYPGAFTTLGGRKLFVWEAKLFDFVPSAVDLASARAGEIVAAVAEGSVKGLLVATANEDHPLLVTAAEQEDGQPIDLDDGGSRWLRRQSTADPLVFDR
jgi:methionyl-tRNA formyltransferase